MAMTGGLSPSTAPMARHGRKQSSADYISVLGISPADLSVVTRLDRTLARWRQVEPRWPTSLRHDERERPGMATYRETHSVL